MPSPFAHLTAGYIVSRVYGDKLQLRGKPKQAVLLKTALLAGISLLPDLDAVPGILLGDIGRFHNNASHSLLAGILVALLTASLLSERIRAAWLPWFTASFFAYVLHVSMDMFTGDRGVLLLWPVPVRFTSPVKLFYGVQWGLGLFSLWHLWTIVSELLFFLVIFTLVRLFTALKTRIFHPVDNSGKIP